MQVNIGKILNLNCGERCKDSIDHCNFVHNLSSCESNACKKFRPEQDLNPQPCVFSDAVL